MVGNGFKPFPTRYIFIFQGQSDKNYGLKIFVLMLSTIMAISVIWWASVREQSVDWISAHVLHQPSGYAISQTKDGLTIVNNVIKNFEITLPKDFKVIEGKNPFFYLVDQDESICQIQSNIINYKEQTDIDTLKQQDESLIETTAGSVKALKKEQTIKQGDFIYELQIPQNQSTIKYSLLTDGVNKDKCRNYFEQIRKSFINY